MDRSNLYFTPPKTAYALMKPFDMTTSNRTAWAIAFSTENGRLVDTSLSVVFTLMFSWLWGLITAAIIYCVPHSFSRRRLVAVVALRNSSSPWSSLQALAGFTSDSMGWFSPTKYDRPSTWKDSLFGFSIAAVSLAALVLRIIMAVLAPPLLHLGNVAPVTTTNLYYPKVQKLPQEIHRAFRGDPSLRALNSVGIFEEMIKSRVTVQPDAIVTQSGNEDEPHYGLSYSYTITGAEFGLKRASDLRLSVRGACRTEYGWFNDTEQDDDVDSYSLFNEPSNTFTVNLTGAALSFSPRAGFAITGSFDKYQNQTLEGNVSYAVVGTFAHRRSSSAGTDPWYLTEPWEDGGGETPYRIKARRPALSCWHQDTWSCCGGKSVTGGLNLENLRRLQVPQVLREVLGIALLSPPVQRLGEAAGTSALVSVVSSLDAKDGVLNAGSSSILEDMSHLIKAGFISTLNILADATRFHPSDDDMKNSNWFYNNLALRDGADGFVVFTPEVSTFDLTGLIAIASITTVLLVLRVTIMIKTSFHGNIYAYPPDRDDMDPNQDAPRFNRDRWARFRAFSAVHLLRNTFENGAGVPEKDWKCSEGLPGPKEDKPLQLVRCGRSEYGCAGHIATQPDLLVVQHPQSRKRHRSKVNSLLTLLGDEDNSLSHVFDDTSKLKNLGTVTTTPLHGYLTSSSSSSTPGQENMWSPDIQRNYINDGAPNYSQVPYNPYFSPAPQQTSTSTQQYRDGIEMNSAPFTQQTTYYTR